MLAQNHHKKLITGQIMITTAFLIRALQTAPGCYGGRNMGGGFSALGLALVDNQHLEAFKAHMDHEYSQAFSSPLTYITIQLSQGVGCLGSHQLVEPGPQPLANDFGYFARDCAEVAY